MLLLARCLCAGRSCAVWRPRAADIRSDSRGQQKEKKDDGYISGSMKGDDLRWQVDQWVLGTDDAGGASMVAVVWRLASVRSGGGCFKRALRVRARFV